MTAFRPDARLQAAHRALADAAATVAAAALACQPADKAKQLRRALEAESAALTVQCDLPSAELRVLVDGAGYEHPECLLTVALVPPDAAPALDVTLN